MYTFRITTNGTMRNYRSNLMNSRQNLNDSMQKVMTHRQFTSYAEDPAAASRAFQLRRSLWRNEDQIDNNKSVYSRYQTGFVAMDSIVDGDIDHPGLDPIAESLEILNGPIGEGRKPLGQTLLSKADAIVQTMNCTYGDVFVFAGADGLHVPFTWEQETNEDGSVRKYLAYRGIDVNTTPLPEKTINAPEFFVKDEANTPTTSITKYDKYSDQPATENGEQLYYPDGTPVYEQADDAKALTDDDGNEIKEDVCFRDETKTQANLAAYNVKRDKSIEDYAKLKEFSDEATYVDIGLGFEEDETGKMIGSSAFNSALCGLNFMGFGKDEDGDSLNLVTLMQELGDIAYRCDPDTGAYRNEDGTIDESGALAERDNVLTKKLRAAIDRASEAHVRLDADAQYLQSNEKQLNTKHDTMETQREDIEAIDPVYAITQMSWAQYCYNAALRIGNDILSQSLLDYMN